MRGPEFDLSQPLGGPRWGEGRRDSRSDRVVGEGFLGATTHSDAAATEIGRIVDRFLTSMRSAIGQVMEVLPIDPEILAPVKEAAKPNRSHFIFCRLTPMAMACSSPKVMISNSLVKRIKIRMPTTTIGVKIATSDHSLREKLPICQ